MTKEEKIATGFIGIASPLLGASVSLAMVEAWMRIASLAVGILVGLVTITMLLRPWWKERRWKTRRDRSRRRARS